MDDGSRYPVDVIEFSNANNRAWHIHPTQKPADLLAYLIRTYTDEGGTVLDPFAGSASTGIACMDTGRKFIGFEKDAGYCAKAMERIERHRRELPGGSPIEQMLDGQTDIFDFMD